MFGLQFCRVEGTDDWHYLTLQPFSCANCSNYISCELCVESNLCEWWVEDARCSRRGRAPTTAIIDLSQCPVPCHLRPNCSQCLDDKGRCVWCEATQVRQRFIFFLLAILKKDIYRISIRLRVVLIFTSPKKPT